MLGNVGLVEYTIVAGLATLFTAVAVPFSAPDGLKLAAIAPADTLFVTLGAILDTALEVQGAAAQNGTAKGVVPVL
jgi:hypothetical protein